MLELLVQGALTGCCPIDEDHRRSGLPFQGRSRLRQRGTSYHGIPCQAEEGHQEGAHIRLASQDEQPALAWGRRPWNLVWMLFLGHAVTPPLTVAIACSTEQRDSARLLPSLRGDHTMPGLQPWLPAVTVVLQLRDAPSFSGPSRLRPQGRPSAGSSRGRTNEMVVP